MPRNSRRNNESTNSLRVPEVAEEFSPPPSRIPMAKWQEILGQEQASHVAGFIREEIVRSAADAICEGHLRRAAYGFVVDCAYEAWMRAFRVIQRAAFARPRHRSYDRSYSQWAHLEYDDRGMSDGCPVPEETPSLIAKHPRSRRVPTVYGRLAKLAESRKSPSRREATGAKSALHGRSGRLRTKIRN